MNEPTAAKVIMAVVIFACFAVLQIAFFELYRNAVNELQRPPPQKNPDLTKTLVTALTVA